MKIELKKFQYFERMSEETTAFASDIHVEGKKVGYAKNDGHGGETYYHFYEGGRDLMNKAEKFCKSLPPIVLDGLSGKPFEIKMDLTHFIDDLVETEIKAKEEKKLNKFKETCLVIGHKLKKGSYSYINFKQPLSSVPLAELQKYVDKYKTKMKPTECFWNTNLEELGIKL